MRSLMMSQATSWEVNVESRLADQTLIRREKLAFQCAGHPFSRRISLSGAQTCP